MKIFYCCWTNVSTVVFFAVNTAKNFQLIVLFAKKLDVKAAALLRDLKNCYWIVETKCLKNTFWTLLLIILAWVMWLLVSLIYKFQKKLKKKSFVVKSYQKSQNNRAQVINKTLSDRRHFEYNMKGRKRHFYARSSDLKS